MQTLEVEDAGGAAAYALPAARRRGREESRMELREAMESTGTCRFYRPDPVPEAVLARVLEAARFAPSGGNRQPVRFVAVRDPATRRRLRELYLPPWQAYLKGIGEGAVRVGAQRRVVEAADHFARNLDQVPVLVVVCAVLADLHPTDAGLGRLSIVGGASVYPAVQNLLLAARDEGLGTALTTLLCLAEPEVKRLLAIPDGVATAATVALGYPARPFPARLARRPLAEVAFAERWGAPLPGGAGA